MKNGIYERGKPLFKDAAMPHFIYFHASLVHDMPRIVTMKSACYSSSPVLEWSEQDESNYDRCDPRITKEACRANYDFGVNAIRLGQGLGEHTGMLGKLIPLNALAIF